MRSASEFADQLFDELSQIPTLGCSNEAVLRRALRNKITEAMQEAQNTNEDNFSDVLMETPDRKPPEDY